MLNLRVYRIRLLILRYHLPLLFLLPLVHPLAEHAARVLKAESLGLLDGRDVNPATLACLDNIDENPRAKRQCSWDLLDPATVDDYLRDGHKLLKHHASEKGGGRCGQ